MKSGDLIIMSILLTLIVLLLPIISFFVTKKKRMVAKSINLVLKYEVFVYILVLCVIQIVIIKIFLPEGWENKSIIGRLVSTIPLWIICGYGLCNTFASYIGLKEFSFQLNELFVEKFPEGKKRKITLRQVVVQVLISLLVLLIFIVIYGLVWIYKNWVRPGN